MATKASKPTPQKPEGTTSPTESGGASSPSGAIVRRFCTLFSGYSKAYGTFEIKKADEKGKMAGTAKTIRGLASAEVYERHLSGVGAGLGIVPLRDDDTVVFGAIDYDNRKADHLKAEEAVKKLALPLIVCRSKSGGAHFYCFTKEPIAASVMRDRLAEWTAKLGMAATTEHFPKQSARFNDNDIGSWINLPYFGGLEGPGDRYAIINGAPATLSSFLSLAESLRVSLDDAQEEAPIAPAAEDLFPEGPPCLQHLASIGGFAEGTRNDGMLNVITYLKKAKPDDWRSHVDRYNQRLANLGSAEIEDLKKTHSKGKSYNYTCKRPPINAHCNRRACLGRLYGVGEGTPESKGMDIQALTRYDSAQGDEPLWGMEINGKRVMVSNNQFYSRDEFNRQCMAQANVLPIRMPPARWLAYLGEIIQTATYVPMPADAGPTGQLWEWVENFCLQKASAMEKEEVYLGKPWREDGKVYFRSHDLFKYLDRHRVKYPSEKHVWSMLGDHGADKKPLHIKTAAGWKYVNTWVLPIPEMALDEAPPLVGLTQTDEF